MSRTTADTEYGVKAIPLGGYVRMIGMFPPGPDGKVRACRPGRMAALIEDARRQSAEEVLTPEDESRTFYRLSVPKKLVVMFGGPVMNLILATILFTVVFVGFGTPASTLTVETVSPCVPTVSRTSDGCGPGSPTSPAAAAGLQPGDTVMSFNGTPVSSWRQLADLIHQSPVGSTATIGVERNGTPMTLTTTMAGVPTSKISNTDGITAPEVAFLGMSPTVTLVRQPLSAVPAQMWDLTVVSAKAMISIPEKMVGVTKAAFSGDERDPNGPIGVVGVTRISGDVASSSEMPASWKVAQFIGLVASLNLFLFLFNLIPLLPLDGGHIAGALWEGLRRRIAKFRGRPDPGPVDVAKALPVAYAVSFLLIGMSAILLYADLVNPVRLGS